MSTVAMAHGAGESDALRARRLLPVAALGACGAGLVAAKLAASQHPLAVLGLAGLLVPAAIWKWRQAGVFLLLGAATTVEQFTYSAGTHPGVFTTHIPLYGGVTKGGGVSLLDLLIGLVFVFWLMRGVLDRSWEAPRSPVSRGLIALLALVVLAVGIGLSHGGKSQVILYEVRPWFYLSVAYLLAGSLLRTRTALRGVMWVLVIGTGFKALQGVQMYIAVRHQPVPPEVILSHEESFFFGLFLILTLSLWLFGVRGRLRTVATWLAPAVLLADMANARRTAWAIIGTTLIVLICVAYSSLPEKRPALRRLLLIVAGISAVYFPLFWSKAGLLAQPARSLHSMISPDARDLSSNLYRVQENANLAFNIRKTASLGKGFGPLIEYALPITDISKIDSRKLISRRFYFGSSHFSGTSYHSVGMRPVQCKRAHRPTRSRCGGRGEGSCPRVRATATERRIRVVYPEPRPSTAPPDNRPSEKNAPSLRPARARRSRSPASPGT